MIYTRFCTGALIALLAGCSSSDSPDTTDGSGDGSTAPVISAANVELLLREIVKVANDDTLNAASESLVPVFGSVETLIAEVIADGASSGNGLTFVSSTVVNEDGSNSEYTFSCDSGGTLVARAYHDDSVGGPYVDQLVADSACSIGDAAYEGSAYKAVRFVRGTDVSTFENFSVSYADGDSLLLDGEYSDSSPEQNGPVVITGWTGASLLMVDDGETTKIDDYTSYRRSQVQSDLPDSDLLAGGPGAAATVTFTVTASWSSGEPIDVVVDLAYMDPEDSVVGEGGEYPAQWQTGSVRVTAEDGSGLTLSPDTGELETFLVAIDGEPGAPIILNWSDGFQLSCASGFDCN
ncbi:hypothetical protein [Granulosicoccus antarcticus]|uniref:Uncharacterized protein n=1 Tax=Granulosicoccus antarcticus IMCC3135 TaxID=1192854 RepID=A0A2Z2P5D6_9GAMM|nr:hypothetical protein [Granulosicoccus antarcticus]ASJ76710.1 hypothetical protein IMCC3135_33330 [Granulosicoccus antarcticus IMCC3135]